ncbi:oligosaccharide flippase family protein [Miltoncostaea marina]|uniref:oligosaccharide flippase family protein n=1 Tax=Miltoncostaea marina TaxID=2843215 RepID=UPI001C3E8045|nr:oligosaccharide flippase family protein [Miltoncostaea marina]
MTAVRGGALLFAAMVIANATNYGFTIIAGRVLGPAEYGVLTALLVLVMLIQLPLASVQMAVSREVAHRAASGREIDAAALVGRLLRMAGVATAVMAVAFVAAMAPLSHMLQIDGLGPMAITGLCLLPTVATVVLMGDLQGLQRYGSLSAAVALPPVLRLAMFAALVALGASLYGALLATAVAAIAGLAAAAWWARHTLRAKVAEIHVDSVAFLRYLAPVALGVLAVTALTNIDVLVVKGRLSPEDAGIYGAASNLAKLAVLLPSAIIGVLFPRVAARVARGEDSIDILGRALVVTMGFCALLLGTYAVLGETIVELSFGDEYAEAASLLVIFCIGMTCFSMANVLVSYELSLGRHAYAAALAGAAAVHVLLLCVVPADLVALLWVNVAVGLAILAVYQLQRGGVFAAIWLGAAHVHRQVAPAQRIASGMRVLAARRAIVAEAGLVLAGATLAAVALTWPLAADVGHGVLGRGDPLGTVAWLWRTTQEGGFSIAGQTHVALTGAPFGWEQGNGVNIQWLLPYLPAHLLTPVIGEVAAYNLVVLAGLALSGAAMYWLVRRLGAGAAAAAWGGLAYMGFPWLLARAENHASLTHVWGFPLLILAIVVWARRRDARGAVAVAGALGALWMTSGYYGLMGLVIVGVAIPAAMLAGAEGSVRGRVRDAGIAWGASAAAVLTVFLISRLGAGDSAFGLDGGVGELATYGARAHEYVVPPATNPYVGDRTADYLAARQHGSNPGETSLYVGLLTLALAAAWLGRGILRRRALGRDERRLLLVLPVLALAAVAFSLPSPLTIAGHEVTTPARLVHAAATEFRVPSRFVVVLMAALVPMAALGLAMAIRSAGGLAHRLTGRAGAATAAAACLGLLAIAASQLELRTDRTAIVPLDDAPPEYALLDRAPAGIVAEYPLLASREPASAETLVWQRGHGRRLLNGAPAGTPGDGVRAGVLDPAAPGAAGSLAALGVTAVIDRRDPARALELGAGYELIGRAANGVAVWRVTARPGVAVSLTGFGEPEAAGAGTWMQWSVADRGEIIVVAPEPGLYRATFQVGSYGPARSVAVAGATGARTIRAGAIEPRELLLRLPRGRSRIGWSTDPGPQPIPDGRSVGITMSGWTVTPARRAAPGDAVIAAPVGGG